LNSNKLQCWYKHYAAKLLELQKRIYLMKKSFCLTIFLFSGMANAGLVKLEWTSTIPVDGWSGNVPAQFDESITTTFIVDNGSDTISSQIWDESHFVSYRLEGANGWWVESTFIDVSRSDGKFSTSTTGLVLTAGKWFGGFESGGTINTSWASIIDVGWWNNGSGELFCSSLFFVSTRDCVIAENPYLNLTRSSWKIAPTVIIPISINKCSLRMCPASFNRGAVLQEWQFPFKRLQRRVKVAGAFPSGEI
jgi:hypothetical protein